MNLIICISYGLFGENRVEKDQAYARDDKDSRQTFSIKVIFSLFLSTTWHVWFAEKNVGN